MFGRILPFILCPALLAAGGCARSDDGTVLIPRQLDVRRVWDRPPQPAQVNAPPVTAGVFPAPPEPARPAPRRYRKPSPLTPPMDTQLPNASSGPEKGLACRNVTESGKRFRVVCD
ncbi:hypothetical protein [Mesorhizobium sp. ORS 3428]|uniref:hypothetical protein n=1 Tax=Mesorhizobium sp. ORS 3428 TaxID=540997 RepID=UPI0008D96ACA|nr:hypothetical protein [Mesorhizobium sp. ORS 3428]OHV88926.1 hypothetical protein ORS3428_17520 [Mesorhizobium sp. ORS 3428]